MATDKKTTRGRDQASSPPLRFNALDRLLYSKDYDFRQFLREAALDILSRARAFVNADRWRR